MRKELGARLKSIREGFGRSQAQMAEKLNVSQRTYASYERGESEMGVDALGYYVAWGWNANWLTYGVGAERLFLAPIDFHVTDDPLPDHSQALRNETLKIAITLAQEALDGKTLEAEDYAELVSLIYEALANGLKSAQVLAFAKPAARGLGAIDGRESLGQTNKEVAGKS